jgi:hypothetical protein
MHYIKGSKGQIVAIGKESYDRLKKEAISGHINTNRVEPCYDWLINNGITYSTPADDRKHWEVCTSCRAEYKEMRKLIIRLANQRKKNVMHPVDKAIFKLPYGNSYEWEEFIPQVTPETVPNTKEK